MSDEAGGGSLTALPIIETQAGDISAYIPTNVISITDGQIFLESDLFYKGVRPAISVGKSVSRVGGNAQIKAMKSVAGPLRLDLAQYRNLAAYTKLSADELDKASRDQLTRGERITAVLKQRQFAPMTVEQEVAIIYAATKGYLDELPLNTVERFEEGFHVFVAEKYPAIPAGIKEKKAVTPEVETALKEAIPAYMKQFKATLA
jgi:F-type H+-transporting ATPase subunit alpha